MTDRPTRQIPALPPTSGAAIRSTDTGHRVWDARTGGRPTRTRDIRPIYVLLIIAPLEIAARWRARLEGRYG